MRFQRGLATVAFLKARFDAGADHLGMFQPVVENAIRNSQSDSIELAAVRAAIRASTGLYIPTDIVKTLLRRATRAGLLTREGGRFLRASTDRGSTEFESAIEALERANGNLAAHLRAYAASRGHSFASDDDALAMLVQFLDAHHIGVVLGQPIQPRFLNEADKRSHIVAGFVAATIEGGGPNCAILDDIVKGLIVQNALLLRDIPISERHLAGLTVFFDSGVLLQALGYAGPVETQATTEALGLIRAAGARLRAFTGTVNEMETILRVYQDRLGSSAGVRSLRSTPLTHHFLSIKATPSQIRQEIALLTTNLNRLGVRVQDFPEHVKEYTEDERELADALKDHNKGPDADEARIWHDIMAIAGVLTLRAGDRPTGVANAKYVFASGSGRTVDSAVGWYRRSHSHGWSQSSIFGRLQMRHGSCAQRTRRTCHCTR